jgi:hypothetical protein
VPVDRIRRPAVDPLGVLEAETHLHAHLEVGDLALLDVAADLGDLEPLQVPQRLTGPETPLRMACCKLSGELPTISVTR